MQCEKPTTSLQSTKQSHFCHCLKSLPNNSRDSNEKPTYGQTDSPSYHNFRNSFSTWKLQALAVLLSPDFF